MHILDDPDVPHRVRALLAGARRYPAMPADRIRETGRAKAADGSVGPAPAEAVVAMIRFEERYGGLAYPLLNSNGIEYGLEWDATVHADGDGWSFPGISDGDWTWPLDVLIDGRTTMTLQGRRRVVNRDVAQRIEAHALLASVRRLPHATFRVRTAPEVAPVLAEAFLPPRDDAATGPADLWWSDGDTAVHLSLHGWWYGDDDWTANCFTRTAADLPAAVESWKRATAGADASDADWCTLCSRRLNSAEPCPDPPQQPIRFPGSPG
ncbi:hypothetical protein EDD29_2975 [Actinocorallia herbida]|uniref:Uncharacterized protein n=1 Tax=Actinocorallia herbida TaxID=58109 RepID=A0A3N1CVW2_9ACTN|nr:hypothetical protein [Actinocorallia herbida]ROO85431.1 hypothetical protein EDD29_2975 [Actinocorallia herbida]